MNAEIYTKDNCPYCTRAKRLFEKENISYVEINAVINRDILIERVTEETGAAPRTVPQIWVNGKYIGGYDQLALWVESMKPSITESALPTA